MGGNVSGNGELTAGGKLYASVPSLQTNRSDDDFSMFIARFSP